MANSAECNVEEKTVNINLNVVRQEYTVVAANFNDDSNGTPIEDAYSNHENISNIFAAKLAVDRGDFKSNLPKFWETFQQYQKSCVQVISTTNEADEEERERGSGILYMHSEKQVIVVTAAHVINGNSGVKIVLEIDYERTENPDVVKAKQVTITLQEPDIKFKPDEDAAVIFLNTTDSQYLIDIVKEFPCPSRLLTLSEHASGFFMAIHYGDGAYKKVSVGEMTRMSGNYQQLREQVNIDGGAGASGAPLFNFEGDVVAILKSKEKNYDGIRNVTPNVEIERIINYNTGATASHEQNIFEFNEGVKFNKTLSDIRQQLCILKGHTSDVLYIEFTTNGKLLGSTSSDRTIRLWSVKDFNERDHKYIRGNVEWDHATKINLTPDARAFISALANGNTIRVFKVQKKHDGAGNTVTGELDFPQQHKADIINVGVSASGKFIMSCSNDTTIVIWNLKGEVLETLNTNQVNNSFACISPCGRFVASAGFTSDVKLYEVEFSKSGDFKQVSRAMDLKGHSAGVYHFSFSSDCTRMSTVSKDGTWKIWNIDVEYKEGQDPSLLMTGVYSGHHNNMFIGISPDAYVVAITMGRSIGVFNTTTGELEELLENVHSDDISSLTWHPSSHFFASAGGADKHIRVWHNTAGIKAQIRDLEDQLKKVKTESLKTRLEHIILEARSTLEKISS